MQVEARYAAGSGLLLGAGLRWLLVADPQDDAVVDRLWQVLEAAQHSREDVSGTLLAVAETAFGGDVPALALLDLTPGATLELVRGTARVVQDGAERLLSLQPGHGTPRRRFVGGVVAADAVTLAGTEDSSAPAERPGPLIDGIPPEILQARGPDGPPLPRPRPAPADSIARDLKLLQQIAALEPAPDSVPRPSPGAPGSSGPRDTREPDPRLMQAPTDPPASEIRPSSDPEADGPTSSRPAHLEAPPAVPTVWALWCPQGHLTRPDQQLCRVCRQVVAPQQPQQVPRPVLGGLRLPTGEVITLDRGVIVGRQPQPLSDDGEWPHLVTLPREFTYVSRMHLQLTISGWDLLARDLGSRGGSTMRPPGGAAERLHPERPRIVPPGTTLDLAETCSLRFEVGPAPEAGGPA